MLFRISDYAGSVISHGESMNVSVDATTRLPPGTIWEAFINSVTLRVTSSSSILLQRYPVVLSRNMSIVFRTLSTRRRYHCRNETTKFCLKLSDKKVETLKASLKSSKTTVKTEQSNIFLHDAYTWPPWWSKTTRLVWIKNADLFQSRIEEFYTPVRIPQNKIDIKRRSFEFSG